MKKPIVDVQAFGECEVLTESGTKVRLAPLWHRHPAVFIFIRHFACAACRLQVAKILERRAELQKNGAKIYFVGNGSPNYIAIFRAEVKCLGIPILTDPSMTSYKLAGFRHGVWASHHPASVAELGKLILGGHKQKLPSAETGEIWQLGGAIAVNPDGSVPYHYVGRSIGDFIPTPDLESALAARPETARADSK